MADLSQVHLDQFSFPMIYLAVGMLPNLLVTSTSTFFSNNKERIKWTKSLTLYFLSGLEWWCLRM